MERSTVILPYRGLYSNLQAGLRRIKLSMLTEPADHLATTRVAAMQNVLGKTAFITGGVSGIGFGIAQVFVRNGINTVITYRDAQKRNEALARLDGATGEIHAVQLEITDRDGWVRAADEAEQCFGNIHILVNNAGIRVFGPADEAGYDDFDWIMGTNFGGVVNGLVTMLPRIKRHQQGGHVVNVASMASFLPGPQAGIYTASKYAVRGLTECLRDNLAPYQIGVSLMAPALTKSNAAFSALKRPERFANAKSIAQPEALRQFSAIFAVGMEPEEVGEKTLRGILNNDLYILTHPENKDEFEELCQEILNAWPDEPIPPERQAIEDQRRQAKLEAQKRRTELGNLFVKDSE
jgi:NAD(P)-dependent dehydrogenase (short-subunit alcohol dehydrogenase family)